MDKRKHIVIFSHGFGVDKTDLGLFTSISEMLSSFGVDSVMFDYNEYNKELNETFVKSFCEQARILQSVINDTINKNPETIIDIVGHSQGSVMIALCKLAGIRKVVSICPFFHTSIHEVMERHKIFPASEINFQGVSRRVRSDGSITVIPASYWSERFSTNVYDLYNNLALKTDLTVIRAGEDQIMKDPDLLRIFNANIVSIHGDHDFKKEEDRKVLNIIIRKVLIGYL